MYKVLSTALMGMSLLSSSVPLPSGEMVLAVSSNENQVHLLSDENIHTTWHSNQDDGKDYFKLRKESGYSFELDSLALDGLTNVKSVQVRYYGSGFEDGFSRSYDVVDEQVQIDPIDGAPLGLIEMTFTKIDENKQIKIGELEYQLDHES